MKPKIILTVGIPTSGKSTWSKEYLKDHSKTIRTCRDDLRLMLRNTQMCDKDLEAMISVTSFDITQLYINSGYDVIIDQTNCKLKYIKPFTEYFKEEEVEIKIKLFEIPLEEALKRNLERSEKSGIFIPPFIIENMYNNLQELKKNFDFEKYKLD